MSAFFTISFLNTILFLEDRDLEISRDGLGMVDDNEEEEKEEVEEKEEEEEEEEKEEKDQFKHYY